MIFVPQTVTDLEPVNYFAGKRTGVPVLFLNEIGSGNEDFCTCIKQCIPCLTVFTDQIGIDLFKNDRFLMHENVSSGVVGKVFMTKIAGDGTETDIELTDNTFGVYDDGSADDPAYIAFNVDFFKIEQALGFGEYKFRIELQSLFLKPLQVSPSPCFVIRKFSEKAANRTVRIETQQSGKLQHGSDYGDKIFTQQIRLPGALIYSNDGVENDDLQLNNDSRSLVQIKDQTFAEYELEIYLVSSQQMVRTLIDYLFSNKVFVSDYNVYNWVFDPANPSATSYRRLPVKRSANDFKPSRKALRKSFSITMEYAIKNVFKTDT